MPKTIADQKITLWALTEKPADMSAVTVTEIEAGKKISCNIMKSDYQLGASGDNMISEGALCEPGEGQALGSTTYSGNITVFRYYDEKGVPNPEEDWLFDMVREKGTTLYLVEREGPVETTAPSAGQEVSAYEVQTGTPQKPSNRTEGYIKRTISLAVLSAAENKAIAA